MRSQMTMRLDTPEPEWIAILRIEVEQGKTITDVARTIGMKRCSLSLLLSGKYPARTGKVTHKFAHKVLERYKNQVLCPHLREGITASACLAFASAPMSTSDPVKLRHWAACRTCSRNPVTSIGVRDAV